MIKASYKGRQSRSLAILGSLHRGPKTHYMAASITTAVIKTTFRGRILTDKAANSVIACLPDVLDERTYNEDLGLIMNACICTFSVEPKLRLLVVAKGEASFNRLPTVHVVDGKSVFTQSTLPQNIWRTLVQSGIVDRMRSRSQCHVLYPESGTGQIMVVYTSRRLRLGNDDIILKPLDREETLDILRTRGRVLCLLANKVHVTYQYVVTQAYINARHTTMNMSPVTCVWIAKFVADGTVEDYLKLFPKIIPMPTGFNMQSSGLRTWKILNALECQKKQLPQFEESLTFAQAIIQAAL
jgi:hypothetical protein